MIIETNVRLMKKLFLPISIFLVTTAIISIFSFYMYQSQEYKELASDSFIKTSKEFDKKFITDTKIYKEFIKLISKDSTAINLFKADDKEGLYNYYKPIFNRWKKKFNISHFYFHRTNKINFLRVHNYKKSDDFINRVTLNNSIKNKELGAGIEFGINHNLTLRVVYPWYYKNEIIGYIELGKEIDYFTPELSKLQNVDVVFTVDKKLIDINSYKDWLSHSKTNINFKELKNHYIIDSSLKNHNKKLLNILDKTENIYNKEFNNSSKFYYISSKDFIGANKNKIGKMYVLVDFTKKHNSLKHLIINITLIIFFLLVLLLIYYYLLIKKEEKHLISKEKIFINLSIKDSLTQLFNRRYFDIYLQNILSDLLYKEKYISLILVDIDNFKKYNDNYGHQKGDEVLKTVANTMKKSLKRLDDKCFRIGGEEFAIIIVSDKKTIGNKLANLIKENIENLKIEHLYNEEYGKVTISIGINTQQISDIEDKKELFAYADKLLYEAKGNGRNKVISNIK